MSEIKGIDLSGASITDTPKPAAIKIVSPAKAADTTTKVDARPLNISDAAGVETKQSTDPVPEQVVDKQSTAPVDSPVVTENLVEKNGDIKAEIDAAVANAIGEFDLQVNQLYMGPRDLEILGEKLHALYPTDEIQQQAQKNPLSMFNLMLRAFRDGWGTNQAASYMAALQAKVGDTAKHVYESLVKQDDKSLGALADGTTHRLKTDAIDLDGDEARDSFMAAISGLKKIKLLNSGFWVTLRRPLIRELQDIFDAADMEQREIGYSIGSNYALVADLYIKRKFCDALIKYRIIRDSNLVDIYKGDTFFKALSFNDYDMLLYGVLSLMSRKGLRARVVCPECMFATILDKIDMNSCKYINQHLITDEVRDWWNTRIGPDGKPIKRTVADTDKYRNEILNCKHSFIEDFDGTKIRVVLQEPTMAKYFECGEKIVSMIQEVIDEHGADDADRRRVILANLSAHSFHMIAPWVFCLEQLDEKDNIIHRTKNVDSILDTFDITTQDRSVNKVRPLDELGEMCGKSKISYIGTFALECPHCHAKPDIGSDQFYPLEVQSIFFGQLFRLLPQELMPQES